MLRQQKVAQASLDKREGALDNLQNILHQIQMAETDTMVNLIHIIILNSKHLVHLINSTCTDLRSLQERS